jgi:hypothetical protein
MSGTTSVPRPSFGATGFTAPSEAEILAGVQADYNAAFGGNLNPDLSTPQGQLATSETAIIGDVNDQFLWFCNQVDPAFASGRMQDGIGRIYFIERQAATPTVLQVSCSGLSGVVIPVGSLVKDAAGYTYASTQEGVIPGSGSVSIPFACTTDGPIEAGPQTLTIYRSIPGWDTAVTAAAGATGRYVERRADFEARRSASVALNAQGSVPSIRGAILNLDDVLDAYVTHNPTGASVTVGGVTLLPHSLYACVLGGDAQAIGEAIWRKASVGCNYNGDVSVTVYDESYTPPYPSYTVKYQAPVLSPVKLTVTITNSAAVPSDAQDRIRAALVSAFSGADGGARARIGGTLYASRFYAPVALLGSWAQVVSIKIAKGAGSAADNISMDIDEAPTLADGDITVVLA